MKEAPIVTGALRGPSIFHQVRRCSCLIVGEGLRPEREPTNPYDGNAVLLFDSEDVKLGYIDRTSAAVMAPWMDQGYVYLAMVKTPPVFRVRAGSMYLRKDSILVKCTPLRKIEIKKYMEEQA